MEATTKRYISPTTEYDGLFPRAGGNDITIKRGAELGDTMEMIPEVVQRTQWQTSGLALALNKKELKRTCRNIWDFVYKHINYCKDQSGYEQVRSPARSWKDRFRGVDCDCYAVFISSILCNLGVPHLLRITKYGGPCFQHIYPVVIGDDGKEIILDCVTNDFDYEVPYTEKKDFPMELQYLNGPGRQPVSTQPKRYPDLEEEDDLEGNWEGQGTRKGLGLVSAFRPLGDDYITIDNWGGGGGFTPGIIPSRSDLFTTDEPVQPYAEPIFYPEAVIPTPQVATLAPFNPVYQADPVPAIPGDNAGTMYPVFYSEPITSDPRNSPGWIYPVTDPSDTTGTAYPVTDSEPIPVDPSFYTRPVYEAQPVTQAQPKPGYPSSATCTCTWNEGEIGNIYSKIGDAAKKVVSTVTSNASGAVKQVAGLAVDVAREVVETVTRFIPANATLRTAFLTALKLNILNISRRLRWGYTPQIWFADQGGDLDKYERLGKLIVKMENIFRLMGGDPSNIKEAIVSGKGNQVDPIDFGQFGIAGLGTATQTQWSSAQATMREILGPKMFDEEFYRGGVPPSSMQGLAADPVTEGIASIMNILAVIATILNQVGPLHPGAAGNAAMISDFDPVLTTAAENNIDDPQYISAYNAALENMGDLSSFQGIGEIDLTQLTPGPLKTVTSGILRIADNINKLPLTSPLARITSVAANTIQTLLPGPTTAPAANPAGVDYTAMMSNPAAVNNPVQTSAPAANNIATNASNTQAESNLPVQQTAGTQPQTSTGTTGTNDTPPKEQTWLQKNKTLVIVGSVGVVGMGLLIYLSTRNSGNEIQNQATRLNGPGRPYRRKSAARQKYIRI